MRIYLVFLNGWQKYNILIFFANEIARNYIFIFEALFLSLDLLIINLFVMKRIYLFSLVLWMFCITDTYAQECDGQRYVEPIFTNVDAEYGISFGEAPQATLFNPNAMQELTLDFYQPEGDDLEARPLIIWAFGGSFVFGSSISPDLVTLSTRFSELGYVNASINYRLSTDLIWDNEESNAYRAVKKSMQDMKAAVRFFYKDAQTDNLYKVDTTRIYVGGVSAGAIAAVHLAYLDDLNEVPDLIFDEIVTEGGLEGLSGNQGYSSDVKAVINLSGGILDTAWIDAGDLPIVSLHGNEDGIVPYGDETITTLGVNLPFNGSRTVYQRMEELNIDNSFYTFYGAGHTPFVSDSDYMDTTFWLVRDFLYEQTCDVATSTINTENKIAAKLFPNPSLGLSYIEFGESLPLNITLLATDVNGRKVSLSYWNNDNSIEIDGSNLAKGVYFLQLVKDGQRLWRGKWLIGY
jgi:para-nitrobenzyl esterase